MNVLLISQAYPPYPIVGAHRARKLAEAFRAQGHRVVVVTERLPGEGPGPRLDEPGLCVRTVALGDRYRTRATRAMLRLSRLGGGGPLAEAGESGTSVPAEAADAVPAGGTARAGWLRRFVVGMLWLPDDEQRFIRPALREARAILRDGSVDVVYTT